MTNKVGRNDPCPCGSGKKYKNCHMLIEQQESQAAKYTPSGKRKFKAKVLSAKDKSLSIFSRSAPAPQAPPSPDALAKLKFRMAKDDFRQKASEEQLPFKIEPSTETPEARERNLPKPGEEFKATSEDFRKKKE